LIGSLNKKKAIFAVVLGGFAFDGEEVKYRLRKTRPLRNR